MTRDSSEVPCLSTRRLIDYNKIHVQNDYVFEFFDKTRIPRELACCLVISRAVFHVGGTGGRCVEVSITFS